MSLKYMKINKYSLKIKHSQYMVREKYMIRANKRLNN